jgi:glycosyltransferase involved in cell wall biosynthesis
MSEQLRIAQIVPLAAPVTPKSTGSIEQLAYLLTEELVRRGHAVTLFAAGNSRTSAELHAVYPRGYEEDDDLWSWEFHETLNVAAAFEQSREFDVIHSHVYHHALPFVRLVETPVVHSYHVLPDDDVARCYARYPEARVAAISHYQRGFFPGNPRVDVIPHGIDVAAFPFNPKGGDYLLFLGRMLAAKGPAEAIAIAKKVGMRLVLAGPREEEEEEHFASRVLPHVDGRYVEYVGPVDARERGRLLAGAAALVYPIQDPEPFGLVLVEAMACGTPVLAVGIGAVPEIVEDGVSGYHAAEVDRLAELVPDALALDRRRVRRAAVERFDYRRMVDDYEALYRRLAAEKPRLAGPHWNRARRKRRASPWQP